VGIERCSVMAVPASAASMLGYETGNARAWEENL
jgi:hypothetical protein